MPALPSFAGLAYDQTTRKRLKTVVMKQGANYGTMKGCSPLIFFLNRFENQGGATPGDSGSGVIATKNGNY